MLFLLKNMKKKMSEKQISNYLNEISKSILEAKTFYDMWWVLRGSKRPYYVDIMNEYNHYSRAMIVATFNTAIIALYRVTDKRSYNLEKMLNALPKDKFTDKDILAYQEVINKHLVVIEAIKILRNNVFGHNSESLDHSASFKKASFVPDNCNEFIGDLIKVMCEIYRKNENLVHDAFFKSNAANELERIFQTLMIHKVNV